METETILAELRQLGDARAVKIWGRLGLDTTRYYGVNLTKLKALAKKYRRDQALADALWATGIHDARLLATYLAEPKRMTAAQADAWIAESDFWDLTDKICANVVAKAPFAQETLRAWLHGDTEFTKRSGFLLLTCLLNAKAALPDAELEALLETIEREILTERNWVREAMNTALIAIGSRNRALHEKAVAAAQRIGKVEIDYGATSCKAPDACLVLNSPRVLARLG